MVQGEAAAFQFGIKAVAPLQHSQAPATQPQIDPAPAGSIQAPQAPRGGVRGEQGKPYWVQVSLSIFRLVTFMSAYSLPAASGFSYGAIFASVAFDL